MSAERHDTMGAGLELGGIAVSRAIAALRRRDPRAHAFHLYDLDGLAARAARFLSAFVPARVLVAYAIKANGLPAILEVLREAGIGADAGSIGELELAAAAGIDPARVELNGNARTPEEAAWAAARRIHSVNADHVGELDLLERAAVAEGTTLRVALRVNPGIETPGHEYVATGHDEAKFGIAPREALDAWSAAARWPHLDLGGVHLHVGSQVMDLGPLERATEAALALARESAGRGHRLTWLNLGGGFGIDYQGIDEFPLERHARGVIQRVAGAALATGAAADAVIEAAARGHEPKTGFPLVVEPGRWLVGPIGILVSEVLWVKQRDGRRFVVLAAGMNDFLRPALYGARHRIVPVTPRPGGVSAATVVGPVCESADVFATDVPLPPVESGDWLAILDTGAYGAAMASSYNGRGRIAELVFRAGRVRLAREAEAPQELWRGKRDEALE